MSGGQIASLVFAVILLIPGGCFLIFGVSITNGPEATAAGPPLVLIGLAILSVAGLLAWFAFRKRKLPRTPA